MTNTDNRGASTSILFALRQLVPERPLVHREALAVAERQARRLRELLGVNTPVMTDDALMAIPRTRFVIDDELPTSGGTHWRGDHWLIVINATEPYVRQRFSAAHELFHVIAHPKLPSLTPDRAGRNPQREGEHLADYFAGVLLMPRDHLTRLWREGVRQLPTLASMFTTSERAIEVRLNQLGLINQQRCWPAEPTSSHDALAATAPLRPWKAAA